MSEHTPTPWAIGPVTDYVNEVANVRGVTIIGPRKAISCRDEAEFILRAGNAYDDLVAALETLATVTDDDGQPVCWCKYPPKTPSVAVHSINCDDVRAALAKARGES